MLLDSVEHEDQAPPPKKVNGPFHRLGLSERTCMAIRKMGFKLPTPIQRKCIPAILKGLGDVIATAATGSGKTAAFLLPLIEKLDLHSQTVGARGIVLSPTRELAIQTGEVCKKLMAGTDLRLCLLVGGMSMEKQFDHLANNPDILIATPGRLVHHMSEAGVKLTRVQMAIFDEADRLFEMGFENELNTVLDELKLSSRQCILMSATLPTRLVEFATLKFVNPQFVQLDIDKQLSDRLKMQFFYCRASDKIAALLFWLKCVKEEEARVMIFCATTHHVSFIADLLASQRIDCAQISGTMNQDMRDEAMSDFTKKKVKILLATDVAARGVDIQKLEYVFHYDFPSSAKLFVHRSGRTARKNETGTAVSLLIKDDMPFVVELLLFLGRSFKVEHALPPSTDVASTPLKCEVEVEGEGNAPHLDIGGFPDLNEMREAVASRLTEDSGLARLHRSMKAGHAEYLKHRPSASKMSMRRAGEVLNQFGGPQKLAETIHKDLQKFDDGLQRAAGRVLRDKQGGIADIFKSEVKEEGAAKLFKPENPITTDTITEFRPTNAFQSSKTTGIKESVISAMRDTLNARRQVRALACRGFDEDGNLVYSEDEDEDVKEESDIHKTERLEEEEAKSCDEQQETVGKRHLSAAERKALKRARQQGSTDIQTKKRKTTRIVTEEFFLGQERSERDAAQEMELSLNGRIQMARNTMDLVPEDEATMRKARNVMKWNSLKKKYEVTQVDKVGKRIKTRNDSGAVVHGEVQSNGLYRKWARQNDRRVQKVGEIEDSKNVMPRASATRQKADDGDNEPLKLEDLTKDKGLVEKVKSGRKLTHKEQRKLTRLTKLAKQPMTTGSVKLADETKTFKEMKRQEERKAKMRAKSDKTFRESQAKRSKEKFMGKQKAKIASKAKMTRSFTVNRR